MTDTATAGYDFLAGELVKRDAEIERLQAAGRDLLHAIGHDRKDLIDEAVEKMRRALEPKP